VDTHSFSLEIFWLVINSAMLELASAFVPGFEIRSFATAFFGAFVLSLISMLLKWFVMPEKQRSFYGPMGCSPRLIGVNDER
jgi:uncharacterized membrane protein YvlD (DUF360 family)